MRTFAHKIDLQIRDENEQIVTGEELAECLRLAGDNSSDVNYQIQPNQVDQELTLPTPTVDIIYIKGDKGLPCTVKFNSTTGTAFTIRAKGHIFMIVKNVQKVFVSNVNATPIEIRVILAPLG